MIDFDLPGDEPISSHPARIPKTPEDMHGRRVGFGKYTGQRWTRVPIGYIKYAANQMNGEHRRLAALELARRGTTTLTGIDITAHAIDRASLKLHDRWKTEAQPGEGLHSWLARIAGEAYAIAEAPELRETQEPYHFTCTYKNITLVFVVGHLQPTLKTCHPKEDQHA